jgi:hypothetical protein
MAYRIAGIDVHKKMLAVVVSDVEVEGEFQFARRRVGTSRPRNIGDRCGRRFHDDFVNIVLKKPFRKHSQLVRGRVSPSASACNNRRALAPSRRRGEHEGAL